jgi:putative N-acetylmannosamine-6-phosphate epimerase
MERIDEAPAPTWSKTTVSLWDAHNFMEELAKAPSAGGVEQILHDFSEVLTIREKIVLGIIKSRLETSIIYISNMARDLGDRFDEAEQKDLSR